MLVSFFVLLMAGIPVALTLAISGFVFGYLGFGTLLFNLLPHRIFGVVTNTRCSPSRCSCSWAMMLETIAARRGPDGRDRPRSPARCAAASASASSWSAC